MKWSYIELNRLYNQLRLESDDENVCLSSHKEATLINFCDKYYHLVL